MFAAVRSLVGPSLILEFLAFFLAYVALNAILFVIFAVVFGKSDFWVNSSLQRRIEWGFLLAATAFYFVINYLFYTEVYLDSAVSRDHVLVFDATAQSACVFVFATMAYYLSFEVLTGTSSPQMAVHHAFIVLVWGACFHYRQSIYYLYLAGPFEICSVFMCFFTLMGYLKMQDTILFKVNGVVWWLSYLICRVLWGMYILYSVVSQLVFCSGLSARSCEARSPVVVLAMLVSVAGLYLMTCLWFKKITKGMLKAIGCLERKKHVHKDIKPHTS